MGFDGKWNEGDYVLPSPTVAPTKEPEPVLEPIETVALRKDQTRVTTRVEHDGKWHTTVEILEVDRNAGINSSGMQTVRKEIVARGYLS